MAGIIIYPNIACIFSFENESIAYFDAFNMYIPAKELAKTKNSDFNILHTFFQVYFSPLNLFFSLSITGLSKNNIVKMFTKFNAKSDNTKFFVIKSTINNISIPKADFKNKDCPHFI